MSNRFCVILNQGNNILTISKRSHDQLHELRQGHLLIGENTPYKSFSQDNESWHIIGHIDNLPLLNYLLFSHYPSAGHLVSEEIICLAIRRYGMKIIELLKGDFCVIYEDAEGNLTLVTEDESSRLVMAATGSTVEDDGADEINLAQHVAEFGQSGPLPSGYSRKYAYLGEKCGNSAPSCHSPEGVFNTRRRISITRWQDNNLQFIQSFRCPLHSHSALNEDNVEDHGKNALYNGRHSL